MRDPSDTRQVIRTAPPSDEAHAAHEAGIHAVLASCPDGVLLVDPGGLRIVSGNDAMCRMSGYGSRELAGLELARLQAPEAPTGLAAQFDRIRREGRHVAEGVPVLRKDGSVVLADVRLDAFEVGGRRCLAGWFRDATERRLAEDAVRGCRELEDQLGRIAESVPGMICSFRLRPDGTASMPFATAAITAIYGLRPEDVREDFTPILERIHPEDRDRMQRGIAESARTLGPWRDVFRAWHPGRGEVWVEGHSVPRREPDGSILWHGFVQDVTERERAEGALRRSEAKFRVVAENTFDWEFWLGPDGRYLYTSPSCQRITGYAPGEFEADPGLMHRIVHPEDRGQYEAHHRRASEGHPEEEQQFRILHRDGEVRWIGHVCSPVRDEAGAFLGIRGTHRDVSERRRSESRLTTLNACLLGFGADADRNIDSLVQFLGEQLGATCAVYNRLEGGLLHAVGRWHAPVDFPSVDQPEGHICYDVIRSGETGARLIRDLPSTDYARTDPCVRRHGLKTYLGRGVRLEESCVGSLCVVYDQDRDPDPADISLLGIVASAVGGEEKRRRADAAVRESEGRFRALIENAPDGVALCSREGVLTYASPSARRMFGFDAARVGEVDPLAGTHPDDRAAVVGALGELLRDPALTRTVQYRFRRVDGGWIWIESTFTNQIGVPGVDAIVVNFRNIHDRKLAEEALRESEALLQEMGRVARVGGWEFEVATGKGRWTEEVARIHDLEPGVTTTREIGLGFYRGESRLRIEAALERAVRDGEPYDLELELVTAKGAVKWVHTLGHPVLENGRVVRMRGAIQDITAHKQAELELAAEATRRRILIEGSRDGIVVLDREGKVFEANRRFAEMLGYATAEVRQLHVWDWDRDWPRERVLAAIRDLGPEGAQLEGRHWRRDGSSFDVELSNSTAELGGQKLVFCVCHDVTERKRLELQLQQSRKLEAIGQLAGGVAHDFNNILASILMQLGLLQTVAGPDPALRQGLEEMEGEAQRAAALTRQLLMFSRRSVLDVRPLDLNEVVTDLLKMLRRVIGEHVRLLFDGFTGAIPAVSADAGMLEQVLVNLVVNARDAMPRGGSVTLRTTVRTLEDDDVRLNANRRPGRFVCLEVSDTGLGMDKATQGRLFEPFFTTKEPGKGTGLGLATVHGIVAQHRGWVEVESEVGRGTTFRVFLPALAVPAAPAGTESAAPPPEPVRRGTECILLVEDGIQLRRAIGLSLRSLGYRVLEAGTGRQALELWREHGSGIDLLFSDMVMPEGMTGLELADLLRADKPSLKVVISSGYSAEIVQTGGLRQTGITYLAKPYHARTLADTLRASLDGTGSGTLN